MKSKILLCGIFLSVMQISCNKDDDKTASVPLSAQEVKSNSDIDAVADDVLEIAESESNEDPITVRNDTQTFLGGCAQITTETSGDSRIRTIDFGQTNCTLFSGNEVRGKIIITFTNDYNAATRTVSYAFDNFYHNDRHVEGNRDVIKTVLPNGHPNAVINLNMKVTLTNGDVYLRTGTRIREFTSGYNTPFNLFDNEFSFTGSWTTTFPSGTVQVATITSPVIVKFDCAHIVQGTVTITRDNNVAILDYGNGGCDAQATITISGISFTITL